MTPAEGRDGVLRAYDVSRETSERLDIYVAQLTRWQRVKNLVSPSTLADVWTRHIADALQLMRLAPASGEWLDLGTGAGIPGLVLAIAAHDNSNCRMVLIESNARKCAFLSDTIRRTGAAAIVRNARLENVVKEHVGATAICARALAPLAQLLAWTEPLLTTGTIGLFPKGRDASAELTEAARAWRFAHDLIPSRTDSDGRIVRVTDLSRTDA